MTCPTTSSFGTLKPCQILQVTLLLMVSLANRAKKSENPSATSSRSTSNRRARCDKERDHWVVDAIGAPHVGKRSERELTASFVERIAKLMPQLVSSTVHRSIYLSYATAQWSTKVAAIGLSARPYFNRYTDDAIDLCDVLSSFTSQARVTLHGLCRAMGLPGKPDNIDGGEVEKYFRDGRIQDIADYCESDVVNTYRVWLRHELFRGKLTNAAFRASEANLSEFIEARSNIKPHLAELT
jgi:predicted PolB exonuclease-like 3'-5' exonuclease